MPSDEEAPARESPSGIAPRWLLIGAIALGAALTGIVGALPGSQGLTALGWLATTAGVAALVVAIGIYRLQERSQSEAHGELMGQLEAQSELLRQFAEGSPSEAETSVGDALTPEQRAEIESRFGRDSIAATLDPGRGRGRGERALLVRLHDGRLVSVYSDRRDGRVHVRDVGAPGAVRRRGRGGR